MGSWNLFSLTIVMKFLSTGNLLGLALLYSFAVTSIQASLILGTTVLCPALRRLFEGECDCSPKFSLFGINIEASCSQPDGSEYGIKIQRRKVALNLTSIINGNRVEIFIQGRREGLNPQNAVAESCEAKVNGKPCTCTIQGKIAESGIDLGSDCAPHFN